jgi:hypothetical protein
MHRVKRVLQSLWVRLRRKDIVGIDVRVGIMHLVAVRIQWFLMVMENRLSKVRVRSARYHREGIRHARMERRKWTVIRSKAKVIVTNTKVDGISLLTQAMLIKVMVDKMQVMMVTVVMQIKVEWGQQARAVLLTKVALMQQVLLARVQPVGMVMGKMATDLSTMTLRDDRCLRNSVTSRRSTSWMQTYSVASLFDVRM